MADNCEIVETVWRRRETKRQTEKTNLGLYLWEKLIYSTIEQRYHWKLKLIGHKEK